MARRTEQKDGAKKGKRPAGASQTKSGSDTASVGANDTTSGIATLCTGLAVSGFLLWRNRQAMDFSEYNLLNILGILWIPLVVVLLFLRRDPADFGLTSGDTKRGSLAAFVLFLLFAPVILYFAREPASQNYYIGWLSDSGAIVNAWGSVARSGQIQWGRLAYHEAVMGFYMFGWEWYHRGFLLFGLQRWMPTWGAVLVQALLFMALHYGKPWPEFFSSLPGGVVMALLALRYRSFLPCFLLHFLVSAGFDAAVLFHHFR